MTRGDRKTLTEDLSWRLKAGHRYVQVQMRRSRPRNWDRVRVFPGVYGRCIGECDERGVFLIDVPIEPLAEFLGVATPKRSEP
jgi:hypothetical protein